MKKQIIKALAFILALSIPTVALAHGHRKHHRPQPIRHCKTCTCFDHCGDDFPETTIEPTAAPEVTAEPITPEESAPVAVAWVDMWAGNCNPLPMTSENGWEFDLCFYNSSPVPFYPSTFIITEEDKDGNRTTSEYYLPEWAALEVINPDETVGFPMTITNLDLVAVDYELHGTDANGNELQFGTRVDLSQEVG